MMFCCLDSKQGIMECEGLTAGPSVRAGFVFQQDSESRIPETSWRDQFNSL